MKYFYNTLDIPELKPDQMYHSWDDFKDIPVYVLTPELEKKYYGDDPDFNDMWVVYDPFNGYSWDAVECKDIEEARKYMFDASNFSLYEYYHDL